MQGLAETLRGGAWNNNDNNVRCAIRNNNQPDNRNNNVGFRVVSHGFPLACMRCTRPEFRGGYGFRGEDEKPVQPVPVRAWLAAMPDKYRRGLLSAHDRPTAGLEQTRFPGRAA